MILKIKNLLKRRKAKMFLMFLICSSLIWLIDNLSESYIDNATFDLKYINVPDSLLLTKVSKEEVDVKIQANGFQFLGFNVKNKSVNIDLSSINSSNGKFFLGQDVYRKQIDKQLRAMTLLEIDRDTLFLEFMPLDEKEVPVVSKVKIKLSQNYILDGDIRIEPGTINIKGPRTIINDIQELSTIEAEFPEKTTNFTHEVELYKNPEYKNVTYSSNSVFIVGKVARFSEKIIEVPIKVLNLPDSLQIRTFPDHVLVLCRAKIDELKNLDSTGFVVVADYEHIKNRTSKTIGLELLKTPENLHSAQLTEKQVEYILKRE